MFFNKPKGWDALSEPEKAWAKSLRKDNVGAMLNSCAAKNHVSHVRFIIENGPRYHLNAEDLKKALLAAAKNDAAEILTAMLETGDKQGYLSGRSSFYMESWRTKDNLLQDILDAAAGAGSKAAWDAILAWNAGPETGQRLRDWNVIKSAVRHKFGAGLEEILEDAGENRASLFADALTAAADASAAHVSFVLQFFEPAPEMNKALDAALAAVAAAGAEERARLLLEKGADIDFRNGEPLWQAVSHGRFDMMKYLLGAGADLAAYGDALLMKIREKCPQSPALEHLDKEYQKAVVGREKRRLERQRFSLAGPETLAETLPLPSGGTLTLLFNFATRQQIILVQEDPAAKKTASFKVVNFSDIENYETIERAGRKLVELGGDAKVVEACTRQRKNFFPRGGNP